MVDIEYPNGLLFYDWLRRWPLSAERCELFDGCPHWSGGPWGPEDVERAGRLFRGWRALLGPEGCGLVLVRPGSVQEVRWTADGYLDVAHQNGMVSGECHPGQM